MISSNRKNPHLLAKLYNRELSSQFLKGKRATHKPAKQLFNLVPNRLLFPLNKTIPDIGADILMGATKCGRFLVGYNFSLDSDSDLAPAAYRYRLSIWSFVPGRQAKKIASVRLFEVTRFSYLEVQDLLTISIVQWPNVPDYLVVYGSCQRSLEYEIVDELNEYTVFSTVTSLPSLACKDCIAIQQNGSADVLDVRCTKHGLTIHSSFSLPSYYEFNPVLSTSTDYQITVNTGSFVHVVKFTLSQVPKKCSSLQQLAETSFNDKTDARIIRNAPFVNRLSYSFLTDNSYMIIISDFWVPKILSLLLEWIKLGHQIEIKDLPFYMKYAIQKNSKFLSNLGVSSEAASSIVLSNSNAHEILFSPYSASRPRWFSCRKTNRNTHSNQPPDKIYDFAEDGIGVGWKFDSFRKWCLAKKVYEFPSGDEDHHQENIRPVIPPRPPRQNLRSVKEEARESTVARFVSGLSRELRPRKRRRASSLRANWVNSSLWMGPQFEMADDVVRIMRRGFGHQPVSQFSVAKSFTHSFAEPSLLTAPSQPQQHTIDPYDDEVDLCLPVRLFGANYSELVRVPGSLKNLQCNITTVEQTVLDVESVCYRAMEKVCQAENYKFKYLHDLDSDIVQTCPSSGDILLLFISRLVAKNLSAKRSRVSLPERSDDDKECDKMYDCTFIVIWSPEDQSCYLEGYSGLTEVGNNGTRPSVVGQAVREAQRLRTKANTAFGYPAASAPRCTTHAADIGHFLSSTLLVDQDNLIGFVKL